MTLRDCVEFVGTIVVDGIERELIVRIFKPEPNTEAGDYLCRIDAPYLCLEGDRVFGVDEDQAWELAVRWLNMRAEGKVIRNERRDVIEGFPFPARFPE